MFVLGEGQEFVPRLDFQGTNGGQNSGKHLQMHGKCSKQKKGREKYPNPNLIIANNLQYVFLFNILIIRWLSLFSDAKIPEYIPEGFVGADFADDFAEVVEGFAEVLGYQVRREGRDMEAGADTLES